MSVSQNVGVAVPTNWKSNIEQVVRGYETDPAKGLVHGLQKDALQNSWGAKVNKKGTGWGTKFELINNGQHGVFLTIEDWGTTGMTGPNLDMEDIDNMTDDLPADHKLARFSAMNYSGGNEGAGLFGRGKLLFSAASSDYHFYFETYTENEGYRANFKKLEGNSLNVGPKALEEEEARNYIVTQTGIQPITRYGSRIIIVNPLLEIVESVENGSFINFIEETWWRIIVKYNADIKVVNNGAIQKANIPAQYLNATNERNGWEAWRRGEVRVPGYHKIKKIELFVSQEAVDEELRGVYFYRRDMKIGEIPLDIPSSIQKKYFGFVEVDSDWEEELAQHETLEHYGVKNRGINCFRKLKVKVLDEHNAFMEKLGLVRRQRNHNEILKEELSEISQDLDIFFDSLDLEKIESNATRKETIEATWNGVEFPNERKDRVVTGDVIKNIRFKIKNNSGSTRKIGYNLKVVHQSRDVLTLDSGEISIQGSDEELFGPFELLIDTPLVKYEKNFLRLEVFIPGTSKEVVKQIPIYYDTTQVTQPGHSFLVKCINMDFPHDDSKRINTNEKITNIKYSVENNSSERAYIAFHLSTHDVNQGNDMLESIILKKDIVLEPYDKIDLDCPEILFNEDIYQSKVSRGKVEIRARISAAEDFGEYETADVLSKGSKILVFFNQDGDGASNTFSDFNMIVGDETKKRSGIKNVQGNWIFDLYIDHPAYKRVLDDEDSRREYLSEEMMKQMVKAHLEEGNYSILNVESQAPSGEDIEDLTSIEFIEKVYHTLDVLQHKRLKEYEV